MSLYWSQWQADFYISDVIRCLRDDWRANVVRAPLGIHRGGYLENPEREFKKIRNVIEAAIRFDLYIVLDWHAHDPEAKAAEVLFDSVARAYGSYPHLIYEIWNEPSDKYNWGKTIKPYHERVGATVRKHTTTNLLVLGTPNWCRDVELAANDPAEITNAAYALHFYSGSHGQSLRDKAKVALNMGLPLLVTEWGTVFADGDGPVNSAETTKWLNFLEANEIGHINWSFSDVPEGSAALVKSTYGLQGTRPRLSRSGRIVKAWLRRRSARDNFMAHLDRLRRSLF